MTLPVIVFGAALYPDGSPRPVLLARVQAAFHFGKSRQDCLYIVTGGVPQGGRTEADVMSGLLREAGVPSAAILPEDRSGDTYESAIACHQMLRERGYDGPVAVVTSDFHMMRCTAMLRTLGWSIVAVPAPTRSDISLQRLIWVHAREYPATVWDVFLVLLWRLRQ
ncbi:YdcF family protein [Acetobacter conturbans]|uniref:YdcF family protein n=1 Tax=Acetobacter conturbans TaxID=1737472 RepID=A0ABX0K053_9PROT|nr:YdcF family protein [Acetobacter conturbans]NHN88635.1 YdcF family protein [Acetobacter conturbans]